MNYTPVIGLEVHVELKTKSKMFCGCEANYFGQKPNTHTCPVCLGMPGGLPVPNRQAIEWCIMIAQALGCEINLFSKFDRKNYFYPDLAKGYQISQYDLPFGKNGEMVLSSGKKIRIMRVHMEEDTGKLMHETINNEHVSLIDFNRSGVPLVEIVTQPDFDNSSDVKEYLQRLQQIVRYLNVATANMEKGEMRLEPNISLRRDDQAGLPDYYVEVKNINSFSFVEKAITYELKRQEEILRAGQLPKKETRGFNETKNITVSQRSKEEAMGYRYFPEPDIPPLHFKKGYIDSLQACLPELPEAKRARFMSEYNLPPSDADVLTKERNLADYFEETVTLGKVHNLTPKKIANVIINKKIDYQSTLPATLIKDIISFETIQTIDESELRKVLQAIIDANPTAVADYKAGKLPIIMFLVGQAMKELKGKAKADIVKTTLEVLLQ